MKVLVAEDDATTALILDRALTKAGYNVTVALDGSEALAAIRKEQYDALLTDWMMPRIDGMELIRRVRKEITPLPIIMVITALASSDARMHALETGADEYLAKPFTPGQVLNMLGDCFSRRDQPIPRIAPAVEKPTQASLPPFVGVGITASTGGPEAVIEVVANLTAREKAAYFVLLHGPAWMLESFAERLQRETGMTVRLAEDGMRAIAGEMYVAPGNRHLEITPGTLELQLVDSPPENFVRPAADPLFRSIARTFGAHGIAVVMTGLGRDGSVGAAEISDEGGIVIAQDPETAVARAMPETVINLGLAREVVPLGDIASTIAAQVDSLSSKLNQGAAA